MRGWMLILGLMGYIGLTAVCSVLSYSLAREFVIRTESTGLDLPSFTARQPTATIPVPTPAPELTNTPTNTPPPGVTFTPAPTEAPTEVIPTLDPNDPLAGIDAWNDPRRITILLMGIDQRRALEDAGPYLTDTMIVAQIDPVDKKVGVLSIPRDLWVDIPGFTSARINTANRLGDANALPGGGPGLAMETIRANLGIQVEYYIRINFEVFTEVVSTIAPDGVEVCIEEAIFDDKYPDAGNGFITVQFDPGCQVLDSERLLQYARTRRTQGSDFDRNRRQQQVLREVQEEVLSAGGILNFVTQIPRLWDQLSGAYVTNLSLDTILSLVRLVSEIGTDDVTYGAINNLHVDFAMTEDGQQILIPRQNSIRQVVQETFNPPRDLTLAELREAALAENANIVVYNNTTIPGIASQTQTWLTSQGIPVSGVGNIDPPQDVTAITIRDYTGNPRTVQYLAEVFGLPPDAIRPGTDGLTSADVMVVLGSDIEAILDTE